MTPVELQNILDRLRISRGKFARMLFSSRRSGENWTRDGGKRVPGPVEAMAYLLDVRPELVELLETRSGVTRERKKRGGGRKSQK